LIAPKKRNYALGKEKGFGPNGISPPLICKWKEYWKSGKGGNLIKKRWIKERAS